jgi:hypothetical protein
MLESPQGAGNYVTIGYVNAKCDRLGRKENSHLVTIAIIHK